MAPHAATYATRCCGPRNRKFKKLATGQNRLPILRSTMPLGQTLRRVADRLGRAVADAPERGRELRPHVGDDVADIAPPLQETHPREEDQHVRRVEDELRLRMHPARKEREGGGGAEGPRGSEARPGRTVRVFFTSTIQSTAPSGPIGAPNRRSTQAKPKLK